jgi:hypothetical protein
VIDVFSFILLIYHPRRIYASGLFRRGLPKLLFFYRRSLFEL